MHAGRPCGPLNFLAGCCPHDLADRRLRFSGSRYFSTPTGESLRNSQPDCRQFGSCFCAGFHRPFLLWCRTALFTARKEAQHSQHVDWGWVCLPKGSAGLQDFSLVTILAPHDWLLHPDCSAWGCAMAAAYGLPRGAFLAWNMPRSITVPILAAFPPSPPKRFFPHAERAAEAPMH